MVWYIISMDVKKKTVIGVTGPIASGKDEVCKILKGYGFYVIDADRIGHQVLKELPAKKRIIAAFGRKALGTKGEVSRNKLGRLVFSDRKRLLLLNSIMHPVMRKKIAGLVERTQKKKIAINAAVLKEMGLAGYCDRIWLVLASKKNRLKRLAKRGKRSKEMLRRMAFQRKPGSYKKETDIKIHNNGAKRGLKTKISKIISDGC